MKRFSGYTFIRNAQSQTFEIRRCIKTETVEKLYILICRPNFSPKSNMHCLTESIGYRCQEPDKQE